MSQRILESFFRILLLATVSTAGIAQKKKVDPIDTVKHRYLPTGVRFGFDAIGPIKTYVTKKNWKGWETSADVDFDRYYLALEYGSWARNEDLTSPRLSNNGSVSSIQTGHYNNSGTYFRIGSDINFMLKDPERNMFFLGFRYGTAFNFKESVSYVDSATMSTTSTTTVPPITTTTAALTNNAFHVSASNSGLVAHWIELTTGLRVKIWGPFWMGYTARLKLGITVKGDKNFNTFDVPGYGLAEKGNTWGINYQLFWRFPVRKSPPIKPRA